MMTEKDQRRTTSSMKKAVKMSVYMNLKQLFVISLMLSVSHVVVHSAGTRVTKINKQRSDIVNITMTDNEKSDIVNHHNVLRASEGSSNMEYMSWNESLAVAAADWAVQCVWEHGFPPLPHTNFTSYGQNLYITTAAKNNVTKGIQFWYDEKRDYDYDTLQCTPDELCGHYTQLVYARSRQIGCACHYCSSVKKSKLKNVQYLACNYLPRGNIQGEKPFKKGPPCSKCGGGAGWCKDGLCNSQCSEAGKDCTCEAICHNCAKLDLKTCHCSCLDGWDEADCSERCEDRSEHCDPLPGIRGWPPDWCNHDKHSSHVKRNCPLMCKLCTPDPDAEAGKCPPVSLHDIVALAAVPTKFINLTKVVNSTNLVNSTKSPAGSVFEDNVAKVRDDNASQHQQHHSTVALLLYVILPLTITWKALL